MKTQIPHYKISYAQNFEDLILSGVLRGVEVGFYVDVGANHATQDSVTKIFYDRGWNGINIEPNKVCYEELCRDRSADQNLNIGIATQSGKLQYWRHLTHDGLSSFLDPEFAGFDQADYSREEITVVNLETVLSRYALGKTIHFLKIDVEGLELEVVLGNDWGRFRPWVVCLERGTDRLKSKLLNVFLAENKYSLVFHDGINDYFISEEKFDIWEKFSFSRDVIMDGVVVNQIFIKCIMEMASEIQQLESQLMALHSKD